MMKSLLRKFLAVAAAGALACSAMTVTMAAEPDYASGKADTSTPAFAADVRAMYEGTGKYADYPVATLETTMGTIKIRLFPEEAPKAVENFMTHAAAGYYDGLSFHRVITDFMVQGGDPDGTGGGGESIWGKPFTIEYSQKLHFLRGSLAMANSGQLESNGSQFFIVQGNDYAKNAPALEQMGLVFPDEVKKLYEEVGGVSFLELYNPATGQLGYTKFGYVFEGMDVVDTIAKVPTASEDKPVQPVLMNKVTVTGSFTAPPVEKKNSGGVVAAVVAVLVVAAGVVCFAVYRTKSSAADTKSGDKKNGPNRGNSPPKPNAKS